MDGSGQLDFREFMIGVWNWNTYDATGITKLAFNTMDVDQKGSIDLHEADAMLRMVYASRKADPLLLKQIDINGDGEVSMEELQQTVEEDNSGVRAGLSVAADASSKNTGRAVLGAGNLEEADVLRGV